MNSVTSSFNIYSIPSEHFQLNAQRQFTRMRGASAVYRLPLIRGNNSCFPVTYFVLFYLDKYSQMFSFSILFGQVVVFNYIRIYYKTKVTHDMPGLAQGGGGAIAPPHSKPGNRWSGVSTTFQPLYSREGPGTHCKIHYA